MKKIVIIIEKNQTIGAIGNIAAVLMGQASLEFPELYSSTPIFDKSGLRHTGIQISTVILKAGQGQLVNLVNIIKNADLNIFTLVFSQIGQNLHNRFDEYAELLKKKTKEETGIIGLLIIGEEENLHPITKKYSLFQ
jgi:hypothetical protein